MSMAKGLQRNYRTDLESISIVPEYYKPEQVSRLVVQAIVELAIEIAEQGALDVEETLTEVFSDVIHLSVSDDDTATITVRRK